MLVRVSAEKVVNLSQATEIYRRPNGSVIIWYAFSFPEEAGQGSHDLRGEEAEALWRWLLDNAADATT